MNHLRADAGPDRRPDVVMVGPKTFPPAIGGIETHVHELSIGLANRGHAITVIVPRTRGYRANETIDGVHVIRVPSLPTRYALKLSSIPSVTRQLRKFKGAVVHAHDATGGYAASIASDSRRFVYTMHGIGFHGSDWPTPFRQGIGMMQKKALRRAAHVFCTDVRTKEAVLRLRNQVEVLSSGVDPARFDRRAMQRPHEYEDGAFVVLWVGRLAKVKGLEVMLEAIKHMEPRMREKMRFVFVGDGPLRSDLRRTAGSIKEVKHLGQIDHSKIPPYVSHADVFVLPSLSEGLPISLLEAMAAGVPAVATDVGGVSDQMDKEALMLIPPQSSQKLMEAIIQLHDDSSLAGMLGEKGRALVTSRFTWDKVVDRVAAVYDKLSTP